MQRILSMEMSRSNGESSEYVTKRLCCSIILTVTFFSLVGGFFLGRFIADRSSLQLRMNYNDLSSTVNILNRNLQRTFQHGLNQTAPPCNQIIFLDCNFVQIGRNETGNLLPAAYLNLLNRCFGNG